VLVIIAFFVAIAAMGPGRYSVDRWMRERQKQYQRDLNAAKSVTPAVAGTGSFAPVVEPARPARPAAYVPAPAVPAPANPAPATPAPVVSAPLSFTPTVAVDAPMTDPRPFALPEPFAPEPVAGAQFVPAPSVARAAVTPTEAIPVALPRRSRPAHASR
jgi:hypothetical protein